MTLGTVINVRGTNGAGKTTMMVELAEVIKGELKLLQVEKERWAVPFIADDDGKVAIVGRYDRPTGGCDGIRPIHRIYEAVDELRDLYRIVLFEGGAVSDSLPRWLRLADRGPVVFAFLGTPLNECIKNRSARRQRHGRMLFREGDNRILKDRYHKLLKQHEDLIASIARGDEKRDITVIRGSFQYIANEIFGRIKSVQ
jgi:hypothetical protein